MVWSQIYKGGHAPWCSCHGIMWLYGQTQTTTVSSLTKGWHLVATCRLTQPWMPPSGTYILVTPSILFRHIQDATKLQLSPGLSVLHNFPVAISHKHPNLPWPRVMWKQGWFTFLKPWDSSIYFWSPAAQVHSRHSSNFHDQCTAVVTWPGVTIFTGGWSLPREIIPNLGSF